MKDVNVVMVGDPLGDEVTLACSGGFDEVLGVGQALFGWVTCEQDGRRWKFQAALPKDLSEDGPLDLCFNYYGESGAARITLSARGVPPDEDLWDEPRLHDHPRLAPGLVYAIDRRHEGREGAFTAMLLKHCPKDPSFVWIVQAIPMANLSSGPIDRFTLSRVGVADWIEKIRWAKTVSFLSSGKGESGAPESFLWDDEI
jgi:hypothetical protein